MHQASPGQHIVWLEPGEATQTEFSAVQASVSDLCGQQGHRLKYSELQSSCPRPLPPLRRGEAPNSAGQREGAGPAGQGGRPSRQKANRVALGSPGICVRSQKQSWWASE